MVLLAIIAGVGLVVFIFRELATLHPVVDLSVFTNRTYATGVFIMTILGFVLYGSTVLIPIWLQTLMGYSSLQAGMAMLPRGLGSFIAMPIVGILMSKIEARKLLAAGILMASTSMILLGRLNLNAGYWDIFWPQILQGLSMGLLFVPLTTITNDPIPNQQMGNATSIFNLMRNVGASFGIAGVTTMLARNTQKHINILGANVTEFRPGVQSTLQQLTGFFGAAGSPPGASTHQGYGALFGMVMQQAAMMSFIDIFRFLGIMFSLMLPLILIMRRPQHQRGGAAAAAH
jgi:DHA2 family multidrug resistance protein